MASSEYLIHLFVKVRAGLVSEGGWSLLMVAGPLDGGKAA
jgi:hypothetical protein